ncbi:hypothetical protein [Papillibacter cinnamivorans]|uniref:hypothetical protein n=1 Tax=Papillibacter cinnamivorans TaxID=100176 RepID=UPI00190E5E22|nr:hypothetical protein [Papillibacter cinnamivorans]
MVKFLFLRKKDCPGKAAASVLEIRKKQAPEIIRGPFVGRERKKTQIISEHLVPQWVQKCYAADGNRGEHELRKGKKHRENLRKNILTTAYGKHTLFHHKSLYFRYDGSKKDGVFGGGNPQTRPCSPFASRTYF